MNRYFGFTLLGLTLLLGYLTPQAHGAANASRTVVSSGNSFYKSDRIKLVFVIDQGFGNGIVVWKDTVNNRRVLAANLPWSSNVVNWIAGKGNSEGDNDYTYKTANPGDYGGAWNHWVFVRDVPKRRMKMYLNGDLWHSANCSKWRTMDGITAFKIGSSVAGGGYYQGLIDDFRVYRRALTDSDIEALSDE